MKELIKFIICVVIVVVVWNNFGQVLEIGNRLMDIICDKTLNILTYIS